MRERGFTLLEMLVATLIMGIAIVGLLQNVSTSLRNAERLTERDRAAVLARQVIDDIMVDPKAPMGAQLAGQFDATHGWTATIAPFEYPPQAGPGTEGLDRIQVDYWWMDGDRRKTLTFEAYRRSRLPERGMP